MTDREMLELAAKAAGYRVHGWLNDKLYVINGPNPAEYYDPFPWNPLSDDGDALRLAVKLRLDIQLLDLGVVATNYKAPGRPYAVENYGEDHCAATRRAIVRAAAEIGKHGA
ncbi:MULTISPECIES: hypothetical protein [unclassified Burkholderia]|uniref:hypothetical protein n=1 Tax=unclassified Burkholderia TaxID=2613784 RepID=UPI000F5602A5|nr:MULTISPECIES: hypothetical protein [unclassified Burkholderia]RQR87674.1 hypothetical protein DIE10_06185 [Burkholderia sp. Bp9011]RQR97020.1 hypothetical protein DIE09_06365 [Burkholderia sp. Bp9010]